MLIKKGLDPVNFKSFELIKVQPFKIESILEYYDSIIPDIYGIQIERQQSEQLITSIYRVLRYLYDPFGIKYYFYRLLELSTGRTGGITSSMIPKKIDKRLDYLNLSQRVWSHPCYREEISKESFWEIYDRAVKEAVDFIHMFSSFTDSGKLPSRFLSKVGDISYSKGIRCTSTDRLKYFDSIFDKRQNSPV
jgi:hypothetical protein